MKWSWKQMTNYKLMLKAYTYTYELHKKGICQADEMKNNLNY